LQLDDFILYLDENLDNCQPILDALLNNRVQHRRHRDFFPRGTRDEEWLSYVAERAWVVLTKDKRNRYNEIERELCVATGYESFTSAPETLRVLKWQKLYQLHSQR
jgi:PIN domain-containing protein